MTRDKAYHHFTLLVNADAEKISDILKSPLKVCTQILPVLMLQWLPYFVAMYLLLLLHLGTYAFEVMLSYAEAFSALA